MTERQRHIGAIHFFSRSFKLINERPNDPAILSPERAYGSKDCVPYLSIVIQEQLEKHG
jgi:hypothetical protein